jgi:hypothetical protein
VVLCVFFSNWFSPHLFQFSFSRASSERALLVVCVFVCLTLPRSSRLSGSVLGRVVLLITSKKKGGRGIKEEGGIETEGITKS